jgi:hypothetical protein
MVGSFAGILEGPAFAEVVSVLGFLYQLGQIGQSHSVCFACLSGTQSVAATAKRVFIGTTENGGYLSCDSERTWKPTVRRHILNAQLFGQ